MFSKRALVIATIVYVFIFSPLVVSAKSIKPSQLVSVRIQIIQSMIEYLELEKELLKATSNINVVDLNFVIDLMASLTPTSTNPSLNNPSAYYPENSDYSGTEPNLNGVYPSSAAPTKIPTPQEEESALRNQGFSPEQVLTNPEAQEALRSYREDYEAPATNDQASPAPQVSDSSNAPVDMGGQSANDLLVPWNQAAQTFARGTEATVQDICSRGISFKVKRTGGRNHADSETVAQADTSSFYRLGNVPSWAGRPVIVTVGGKKMAAAIRPYPHSYDTISNGMNGHFDIYFLYSVGHAQPNPKNYPNPMMHQEVLNASLGQCHGQKVELSNTPPA